MAVPSAIAQNDVEKKLTFLTKSTPNQVAVRIKDGNSFQSKFSVLKNGEYLY